jgi:hypothetical protein
LHSKAAKASRANIQELLGMQAIMPPPRAYRRRSHEPAPNFMDGFVLALFKGFVFHAPLLPDGKMLVAKKRYNKKPLSLFTVPGSSKDRISGVLLVIDRQTLQVNAMDSSLCERLNG